MISRFAYGSARPHTVFGFHTCGMSKYLEDILPERHHSGISQPPPTTMVWSLSPTPGRPVYNKSSAKVVQPPLRAKAPPIAQLSHYGHYIQYITFHLNERGLFSSPFSDPGIRRKLEGQVQMTVFSTLLENCCTGLRALEIPGFGTLWQNDRFWENVDWMESLKRVNGLNCWAIDDAVAALIALAARIASSPLSSSSEGTLATPTTLVDPNEQDKSHKANAGRQQQERAPLHFHLIFARSEQ